MPPQAPRDRERRAGFAVAGLFAFLTVYFTGAFPPFADPNELSRQEAVYAFVETGTWRIDDAIRVLGDQEDKAVSGGHFYSNKAPGLAFAAVPVYRALRVFLPAPRSPSAAIFLLLRILTVSLLSVLALFRLAARLAPQGGAATSAQRRSAANSAQQGSAANFSPRRGAALIVFAVAFGTPFLFYARSFFSHTWSAALLFLAWDLVRRREDAVPERGWPLLLAAGLLAGWAAFSEYTAAPLVLFLLLRAAWRRARNAIPFAAGAGIPFLLLLSYNAACFGSPFVLSSAREWRSDFASLAGKGLFGLGAPSPRIAWSLLFDPARGLLLFSPFLVFLLPGFIAWWRSREDRADFWFCLAAMLGLFLPISGYPNWHGGWSLGDRYLLPVIFLAALVLARGLSTPLARGLFSMAAVFSAAVHLLLTASWVHLPPDLSWPPGSASLWFLIHRWAAPNLLSPLGWASLLLPLLACAVAGALALNAAAPLSPRPLLGVSLPLLLFALTLARPPRPPYWVRLWRAAMLGAFSGQDPAREELKRVGLSASSPTEKNMAGGAWRLYGPSR